MNNDEIEIYIVIINKYIIMNIFYINMERPDKKMINRTEIKANTNDRFYRRGRELYDLGKVLNIDVIEEDEFDSVVAEVKGSGRNIYEVKLEINEEYIESYHCTCPAAASYYNMCKHCVASALEYIEYCKIYREHNTSKEEKLEKLLQTNGIEKGLKILTTPSFKVLMNKYTNRQMLPVIDGGLYGKIELIPTMYLERNGVLSVDFKIGIDKKYVLKDVIEFSNRIYNQTEYAYGKQLKFIHMLEAFAPKSKKMVRFICDWVDENKNKYFSYGYYGSTYKDVRYLPLSTKELEQFLAATDNETFYFNAFEKNMEYKVATEKFYYEIQINGNDNGATIISSQLYSIEALGKYIIFSKGKIYVEQLEKWEIVEQLIECGENIFINSEDLPSFCNIILPKIKECCSVKMTNFDENKYVIGKPEIKIYLDMPEKDIVTYNAIATYGEKEYSVFDTKEAALRDLQSENVVSDIIKNVSNAYDDKNKVMALSNDDEKLYMLLTTEIDKLKKIGEVYVSDAIKKLQVIRSAKTTIGISVSGNLLELNITANEMSMDELVDLVCRYNKKKKYYRLKNGNLFCTDNNQLERLTTIKNNLQLTDKEMKKGNVKVPKFRALYLDEQVKSEEIIEANKSEDFRKLVENIRSVEEYEFEIPKKLKNILRNYQKEGFRWIKSLCKNGFGGILADDMGLGKSLQVICFILSEMEQAKDNENKRTLIICPASLLYNWKNEFEKFAPELCVKTVSGNVEERKEIVNGSQKNDILITSYDLLKRDIDVYEDISFFSEIIDEAQYIKNSTTQAAKAVKMINASFRLALTGTPVENRLSELWSEFDYLMPGFLYSYKRYKEQIEQPIVKDNNEETVLCLQKMISPFVLRRLKKDVLMDLPDKVEENMYVSLQGEQQKLYDAHVKRMKLMLEKTNDMEFNNSKIQILAELTKLRQLCCDPSILFEKYKGESVKTDMCIQLIKNAVENGHKVLLFSQFTSMLENLQKRMLKEKISFYTLTGATKKEKRAEMVEAFNSDTTSVFCISLKAGGTGLNLTAADIVIHFDPWWNVAVQNQATDRAHRIGQKNVVNVYKLITKGTIEEKIVNLQEKKQELADMVLGGDNIAKASFSREELLELLK